MRLTQILLLSGGVCVVDLKGYTLILITF